MKIGIALLTKDNVYSIEGELPTRPTGDKEILEYLIDRCEGFVCSRNTEKKLPIRWLEKPFTNDLNLGIETFKTYPPDILLINRSSDTREGKKLRLDGWKKTNLEVWIKDSNA